MNPSSHDRREFLRKTTAVSSAAMAGLLGMPELHANEAPIPDDEKLGVALVGLGSLSTNQIAPALQKTKRCKLAAVVSGTAEKREKWSKKYDLAPEHIYDCQTVDKVADDDVPETARIVCHN